MPDAIPPLFEDDAEASEVLDVQRSLSGKIHVASQLRALWECFHPFADLEFTTRLRHAVRGIRDHQDPGKPRTRAYHMFHQCHWEMYAGSALLQQGIELVPRALWDKSWRGAGPDLCAIVDGLSVWVECVAPGPGEGADAVPELRGDLVARSVPIDQISLRVLSALAAKRKKRDGYVAKGIVKSDDPFVVAINARGVPLAFLDDDPPWVARVLYGLGDYALTLNVTTNEWSTPFLTPQPSISKQSNETIDANLFGSGKAAEVSGVIYSTVDAWNTASNPSYGIFFVHNMTASAPLPNRWLPGSASYSVAIDGERATLDRSDPE